MVRRLFRGIEGSGGAAGPIDFITGTSLGWIVNGLYDTVMPSEGIEKTLTTVDGEDETF